MKETTKYQSWEFLPEAKKEAIASLTRLRMVELHHNKQYGEFAELHSILSTMYQDGFPFDEQMTKCLLLPFSMFGSNAAEILVGYSKLGNQKQSNWITEAQRELMKDVDGEMAAMLIKEEDFELLDQAICVLTTHSITHDLTPNQMEFLEMADAFR